MDRGQIGAGVCICKLIDRKQCSAVCTLIRRPAGLITYCGEDWYVMHLYQLSQYVQSIFLWTCMHDLVIQLCIVRLIIILIDNPPTDRGISNMIISLSSQLTKVPYENLDDLYIQQIELDYLYLLRILSLEKMKHGRYIQSNSRSNLHERQKIMRGTVLYIWPNELLSVDRWQQGTVGTHDNFSIH